jgi:hypothetical protein
MSDDYDPFNDPIIYEIAALAHNTASQEIRRRHPDIKTDELHGMLMSVIARMVTNTDFFAEAPPGEIFAEVFRMLKKDAARKANYEAAERWGVVVD